MVAARPFFRGRPGCVRSSAWIWLVWYVQCQGSSGQFLCSTKGPFLCPDRRHHAAARRGCQGWPPGRPPEGRGLDSVEHGSILQAVGARSPRTIRGEPAVGRNQSRRKLVFGGSKRILTMMQSFASAARLRAVGPFSSSALKPFQMSGSPPPRIVINSPPSDR
jgi:hypothetical protein